MPKNIKADRQTEDVSITFSTSKSPRVRKVIKRSNARPTIKRPSWKKRRMVHCESTLERDACCLYDANPFVANYSEQPALITYRYGDEFRIHYPDFVLQIGERSIFHEVKTDKDAKSLEIAERTQILSKQLPFYGYEYRVLTETDIHQQPRFTNVKYLVRHGREPVDIHAKERIRRYLNKRGVIRIVDIDNDYFLKLQICRLIIEGYLYIDINATWSPNTTIALLKSGQGWRI